MNTQNIQTTKKIVAFMLITFLSTVLITHKINIDERIFYTNVENTDTNETTCPTKGRKCSKTNNIGTLTIWGLLS